MSSSHPEGSHLVPINFTFTQMKVLLDQVQQFSDAGGRAIENLRDQLIDFFKDAPRQLLTPVNFSP